MILTLTRAWGRQATAPRSAGLPRACPKRRLGSCLARHAGAVLGLGCFLWGAAAGQGAERPMGAVVGWGGFTPPDGAERLTNVVAVSSAHAYTLGLRADGSVAAWGLNNHGQLDLPPDLTNVLAIAAGYYHGLAVRADGRVIAWGGWGTVANVNLVPERVQRVRALAGGSQFALALREDGTVVGWGLDHFGQASPPAGLSNVVAVAAGSTHGLALRRDGTVVGWGHDGYHQTAIPASLTNAVAIAAGFFHSLALRADGRVVAWGDNSAGQTRVPAGLTNVVAIAAGDSHSLALCGDGTVVGWGKNDLEQAAPPADLQGVIAIAAGQFSVALRAGPAFLRQPEGGPQHAGTAMELTPLLSGMPPIALQWQFNGADLAGATQTRLRLPRLDPVHGGDYWLVARNTFGAATSRVARVEVVTNQLDLATGFVGGTWFTGGAAPWRRQTAVSHDGVDAAESGPIADLEASVLTNRVTGPGLLTFHWRVSSEAGFDALEFYVQEQLRGRLTGETDWQRAEFEIREGPHLLGWRYVKDRSGAGGRDCGWLDEVRFEPQPLPAITEQPEDAVVAPGGTAVFRVRARGTEPMFYQWRVEGQEWSLGDRPVLKLENVQASQAGMYYAYVGNGYGNQYSRKVRLVVQAPPKIGAAPVPAMTAVGASATFAVAAQGTPPFAYQWFRDGRPIAGATQPTWALYPVAGCDAGRYSVEVVNAFGSIESEPVSLSVARPSGVLAWGDNSSQQLATPSDLTNVVGLGAGHFHGLALRADGTVRAWGGNGDGQAVVPEGLTDVVAISAGLFHNLAVRRNGSVVAWGANGNGACQVPAGLNNAIAVAGGGLHSLALRRDGTVVGWGYNWFAQASPPWDLNDAIAISAGANHSLALRRDGRVAVWGVNLGGITAVPPDLTNVIAIAAGGQHSLALRADGTVAAWGDNSAGQCNVPSDLTNAVAIAAGQAHNLALRADGRLVAWGHNDLGQTVVPTNLTGVTVFAAGHRTSFAATRAPVIVEQTCDPLAVAGGDVDLRVTAIGDDKVFYQWAHEGVNLTGATNRELRLSAVRLADAGTYTVRVSNAAGATVSGPIRLRVAAVPLAFVTPPSPRTAVAEAAFEWTVAATGTAPLRYQWFHDGSQVGGATNASLRFAAVQASDAGEYTVRVTDAVGSIVSPPARLEVFVPPAIVRQSAARFASPGTPVSLSILAEGTRPFRYEWYHGGALVPGQTQSFIDFTAVQPANAGRYRVRVSNEWGSTMSADLWLAVRPARLPEAADYTNALWTTAGHAEWFDQTEVTHDGRAALRSGYLEDQQESSVSTQFEGPGLLTFWWKVSSEPDADFLVLELNGAEGGRLSGEQDWTEHRLALGTGTHTLRWRYVKDASGSAGADAAWLDQVRFEAGPVPILIGVPEDQYVPLGTPATFRVAALGAGPYSYQWRFNGQGLPNTDAAWLKLDAVQATDLGRYSVTVSSPIGYRTSPEAVLSTPTPTLLTQPAPQAVPVGGRARFAVSATGRAPLRYEWLRNGVAIPQAIEPVLALPDVQWCDAGRFAVRVQNAAGTVLSEPAALEVRSPGMVVGWGDHGAGQAYPPTNLLGVGAVAAGRFHSLALFTNGTVLAWGANSNRQTNVPGGLTGVVAVAAGHYHNLALRANGTAVGWGLDQYGQARVSPVYTGLKAVAAGEYHSLALRTNGTLLAWGRSVPGAGTLLTSLKDVAAIAAGANHNLVLRSNGTVVVWGVNAGGQTNVPAGLSNVVQVAGGLAHSLALQADGRVVAWGTNSDHQLEVPAGLTNAVAIAAGLNHSLAVSADGRVFAWGASDAGQGAVPTGLSGVVQVTGGGGHSLALSLAPVITQQACAGAAEVGSDLELWVWATGPLPLVYQWFCNGQPLPGETNALLSLRALERSRAGLYYATVANLRGSTASQPVRVEVREPAPALKIVAGPGRFTLRWPAPASGYLLETTDELTADAWWPMSEGPTPEGAELTLTLPLAERQAFYRLRRR